MPDQIASLPFIVLAVAALYGSVMVVMSHNVVHAAFWLLEVMMAIAGLFMLLSAGFLALAAGVEDLEEPPGPDRLAPAAARGLRGRLLVGDRDVALEGAQALAQAAAAAGLSCALTVRPGAGHEMPEPPGELLAGELVALLDRPARPPGP